MELPIQIRDNNWEGLTIDDAHHLTNLQKIAEKPIGQLSLEDHPNLLIFPQNLEEYGDKIGKQYVFEVKDDTWLEEELFLPSRLRRHGRQLQWRLVKHNLSL